MATGSPCDIGVPEGMSSSDTLPHAQAVKCLLHKYEDLGLTFWMYIKNLGVVACAWNPSAGGR